MTRRRSPVAARGAAAAGQPLRGAVQQPHAARAGADRRRARPTPSSREWSTSGRSRRRHARHLRRVRGAHRLRRRRRASRFTSRSADWQESDRAARRHPDGVRRAAPTRSRSAATARFDGVMLNEFRRPRIEGTFAGEQMRAFDVDWGSVSGTAVIENSYADVKDVVISARQLGDARRRPLLRRLPAPRRRRGDQRAHPRHQPAGGRPAPRVRHRRLRRGRRAVGRVPRLRPLPAAARLRQDDASTDGVAYGEPFDTALARGAASRATACASTTSSSPRAAARGTGAAFVGWNGTYSFNLDGARHPGREPVARVATTRGPAVGPARLHRRRQRHVRRRRATTSRGTVRDFFVGDEGIGQVGGEIGINGDLMTLKLEAASSRLAVSGSGRIALTPEMDAELSFRVTDTSLDPYVRAFEPRLSPYTTAVASGTIRVVGELADIDRLLVDATVDSARHAAVRLPAAQRGADPARARSPHRCGIADMRLVGEDTELEVTGTVNLHDERIAVRATRRRQPRHPAGLRRQHPQLGPRLAGGDARGQHARAAASPAR